MDKEFIRKHNLTEACATFDRIMRNSEVGGLILEADAPGQDEMEMSGDTQQPDGGMGAQGGMPGGMQGQPDMGGAPDMGGMDGGMPGGQDGDINLDDPNIGGADLGGDMPDMGGMPGDENQLQPDDTVIDVDDITNAEEKVNDKVSSLGRDLGKVDDKISKLISALGKIDKYIDRNNQKIEHLRAEIEKRNPTPTEKLNLRSLDSYPFNVNPSDFWRQKAQQNQNYEIYSNNAESNDGEREYEVTLSDIDLTSPEEIMKSFVEDPDDDQDLKKIFNGYI